MTDIVEKLRGYTEDDAYAQPWTFGITVREAADEIAALRAQVQEAQFEHSLMADVLNATQGTRDRALVEALMAIGPGVEWQNEDRWTNGYDAATENIRGAVSALRIPPRVRLPAVVGGDAVREIAAERRRQTEAEGWTPEHDDGHVDHELARAAACYTMRGATNPTPGEPPSDWPWAATWWKPKGYRRDLVRAGALIAAEIERLDRRDARALASEGGRHE